MAQKKATKKFEQRHLKDTLERRNGMKKMKQKQQMKAKKQARKVEENGGPKIEEPQAQAARSKAQEDAKKLQDMTTDEFFQSFEVPEALAKDSKKRKRQGKVQEQSEESEASESDDSVQEPVQAGADDDDDSSSDDEDPETYKQQLAALAENDPEFHKHLQENDPELLAGGLDDIEMSDDEAEAGPKRKKRKGEDSDDEVTDGTNELKMVQVQQWATAMREEHSKRAAKQTVLAFRAAAHISEDEEKNFKYSISDPDVYHLLLTTALKQIPEVLQHHIPVQESKSGKLHVPTEGKQFKDLAPVLKSQVTNIVHLLDNLSDPAMLRLTLTSTLPLLAYILSFKKLVRDLTRAVTAVWSTSSTTEATRIAAFLVLRRLTVIGDAGIRENSLKTAYQGLVKNSRNTTIHTLAGINLMKNSGAELWGADTSVGYTTGFTFIRQLAIHLRSSITHNSNDSYKSVYNWQYVHSLDFWSRVLAAHASVPDSPLRPLIYPLVQVTLGALRLIPTATYFPLRFQLVRSLLRVSLATNTFVPLAASLYEVLASAEMRKPPKSSTLKPLDFETSIRAAKSYLRTRTYQDGIGEQVQELLGEFLGLWCKNIAFPELSLPVVVMLKRWLKDANSRTPGAGNKNQKVNGLITLLVQKVEANSKYVEAKRAKVEFAPRDRRGVENFLNEVKWEKTPLGAFLVGQRKVREEKRRLVEEGRREDEERRKKDKEGEKEDGVDEDGESGSEEDEGEGEGSEIEGEDGVVLGETDDEDGQSE